MAKHQVSNIAKGVGIGVAVGAAVGLIGGAARQPKYQRTAKHTVNKAIKTVNSVLSAIS
jgi:hypothetical protein